MDPTGYHVVNLCVHLLATLTLYGIARRSFRSRALPGRYADSADALGFAVALLWTAHPLATQAVTYVIQRAESLMRPDQRAGSLQPQWGGQALSAGVRDCGLPHHSGSPHQRGASRVHRGGHVARVGV